MNLILNVLTLGMLPLWRMLNGSNIDSPLREAVVLFNFNRWGQPPEAKAKRILKRFYLSSAELREAEHQLLDYSRLFCKDKDLARKLVEQLRNAGFSFREEIWEEVYVWNEATLDYRPASDFNSCRSCGSKSRFYWNDNDDLACSKCGSTEVVDVSELTPAEAIKYLKEVMNVKAAKASASKSAA